MFLVSTVLWYIMLLAVTVGLDFVAVSIWMMILFMLEKLHGPLNHQECSHDAATFGRVKSLFASRFQGIIPTYIQMWSFFRLIHLGVRWSDMRQSCVSK